jgi:hypothetical protein
MPRILPAILAIFAITLAASCDKDAGSPDEEAILHGTWVKGDRAGDTLVFYDRAGKHYMKSNQSFNPDHYSPVEREYGFQNGQLYIKYVWAGGPEKWPVDSFTWTVPGREFEIQGHQLYMFMSSTLARFTFRKVP